MGKFYHSIPFKFAMFILAFFIIVMATAGYTAYMGAKDAILTDRSESIAGTSIRTENLINGWFNEQFTKIEQISSNPFVGNHIERIVHSDVHDIEDVDKSYTILQRYLTSSVKGDDDLIDLTIIGVDGSILIGANESNYDIHHMYNLKKGFSEPVVQYINYNSTASDSTSCISVPVKVDGNTIAIIVAHLNNEEIVPFIEEKKGLGNSGTMYLLNPHNYIESGANDTTFPDNSIALADTLTYGIQKALSGEEGVAIYKNSKGTDVLGSFRWIGDLGVAMIIEVDEDEVLQPINALKTKIFINILLLMLFFSALTLMVVSNTIRSIKKLKSSAEKIASGNLSSRVNIIRKDEIGELANAFNSMADNLDVTAGKLIDSKSKFEAVFEHANVGIMMLDVDGHIIMVNSWAQKRWGEYDGNMSCYEYISGEEGTEADRNSCIGITAIATGETQIKDEMYPNTGSDSTYMEVASPIWDADGNCTGAVIIISDVTDSNKARARLEFTANLFSKTKDFIDLKPTIDVFLKTIVEYSKCDAIAIRLKDGNNYPYYLWHGLDDEVVTSDDSLLCKDTDENDEQVLECLCGCVIDNKTDLLPEHFTEEGSFWSNDVSLLDEYITDDATGIVIRNRCGQMGYKSLALIPVRYKDNILGLIQLNYKQPDKLAFDDIRYYESLAETVGITVENSKLFKNYKNLANELEKKVKYRTEELATANEELMAMNEEFVAINEELVAANEESAQMNEKLAVVNEQLREVDRLKSEFLNTMSHELRTPLTAIIGYSSLLKQKIMGDLTKKQEEYAEGILRSGNHLLMLINEILDLSKIEAGMMKILPEKVHALSVIEDVMISQKPIIAEKGHILEIDVAEDVCHINVDRVRLKQILLNLASNAIKFTEDGGYIILRSYNKEEEVYIDVIDNGIGIRDDDIPKLFKKFSQIDQKLSRKYEGTGLGLAIVKEFTELMGGRICVASTYGEGSIFRIAFPQHPESP